MKPLSTQANLRDLADPLPDSPLPLLARWLAEARASEAIRNPDAMALATVDEMGTPQVRFVLCRGFDATQGSLTFYTHFGSPKGRELDRAGRASAALYWDPLGRQVRLTGRIARVEEAIADAYFAGRHRGSQISAWSSAQSEPIASRAALETQIDATAERLEQEHGGGPIPRPAHWGGYVLVAERIELWAEGADRVHDRGVWRRVARGASSQEGPVAWTSPQRLQP